MTSDTALISILDEQISAYKMLLDLLKRERACLIDFDGQKVEEISKEKDTVIMRLRLLEDERQRLIKKFTEDNGISSDINLEEIGKITGNNIYLELRSKLLSLLQGIEEMNKFNSVLIDRSINHIRTTSGFFNSFGSDNVPQTTGVFLSKET
jgi:flagellar biosynthesis/type III secretory pathway chaperone